jgi:hypothetical protein
VIWRVKFKIMENVAGLVGLCLIGFAVGLFLLSPDWGELARQAVQGLSTGTRESVDVLVLRRRVVWGGDDSVRGVLLLLRCR